MGIDRWIRMEHLVDDFVATFQRLHPLTEDDIAQIHRLPRSNVSPLKQKYKMNFSRRQIQQIDDRNPLWFSLEKQRYDSVLGEA